ncbi:MAG TPA: ABC transporter permease [Acetobacteraceae bacterium]|nr:ABC transporter permease [Acetobacteraceae bacterium]
MTNYLLRRLAGMVVVMFLVATIVFVIAHVIPGDPAAVMLGPAATAVDINALRARLGLDAPLPLQYVQFMHSVIRLRLGDSIFLGRSVTQALAERAPLTIQLTVLAAGLATLIGVPIGILSAVKRGTVIDQAATALSMAGASLPSFWIGLTLIEYLAVRMHWLPVAGYGPPNAGVFERLTYLIMPAIALGIPNSALIIRFTRTSMLDVLQEDYVRTARAKGLGPASVIFKHAFRNARTSVLTVIGLTVAGLLGGAIVTETVFGLPGVGNLVVGAVLRRDYPVIQGALLVISGVYELINLCIDLLYAVLDPRVRY